MTQNQVIDRLVSVLSKQVFIHPELLTELWKVQNHDVRHFVLLCVAYYLGWVPEAPFWVSRHSRMTRNLRAVKVQTNQLRKALLARRQFEELADPHHKQVAAFGEPSMLADFPIREVLEVEVERLEHVARALGVLLNEKRQGLKGPLRHLVLAQLFVSELRSTRKSLLPLRPVELAEIITVLLKERGLPFSSDEAENLRKALATFKLNVHNRVLMEELSKLAKSEVARLLQLSRGS